MAVGNHPTHRRRRARRDQNGRREARLRMSAHPAVRQRRRGDARLAALGFVRETLIANALGAGPVADAFYAAFRFLTSSAACSPRAPSIPPPSSPLRPHPGRRGQEAAAGKFAEDVLAALLVVLMALTAVVMIATPLV